MSEITVKFITLGCKTNLYESEAMAELFRADGWETAHDGETADLYVINTCTVTATGAKKSRQMIHRIRRENPDGIIAVTGCFAQTEPDAALRAGGDIVIGNEGRRMLPSLARDAMKGRRRLNAVTDILGLRSFEELAITGTQSRVRANIKIEDGCSNFCTYCIIPYARGPVRSRPLANIVREAEALAENGYEEVVLTGIHIGSYGMDFADGTGLINVIEALDKISGLKRIRLGSIEPVIITEEFAERAAALSKLCPHFHLSLQSGCTETLRRMNRRYTAEEFWEAAERLRRRIPDTAITTDVMTGFVGETDEEFEESYSFCRDVGFMQMHVFKYSVRKGTRAEKMSGRVSESVKDERSRRMLLLSENMKREFYQNYIGRELSVLLEQKRSDGLYHGTTPNYMDILIKAPDGAEGKIISATGVMYKDGFLLSEAGDQEEN